MDNAQYIKLMPDAIFKKRYDQWFLIHTQNPSQRLLVKDGAELVLTSLFRGRSVGQVAWQFGLNKDGLLVFLKNLNRMTRRKIINFSDQSAKSRYFDLDPPLDSLSCLITNRCNLGCWHCYLDSGPSTTELRVNQWINVIDQFVGLGGFLLNITGGEPLMYPGFWDLADFLKNVPALKNLNTNGTLIGPQYLSALKASFDSVQVSIDGANAEVHDLFRGQKNAFQKTTTAVRLMVEAGIVVNVAFCLTPLNVGQVERMVELCQKLGVNRLSISLAENIGRGVENCIMPAVSGNSSFLAQVFSLTIRLAGLNTSNLKLTLPFQTGEGPEKQFICSGDHTQVAYITADGYVTPCDKLPTDKFGCGNIWYQSLKDIWTSPKMTGFKCRILRQIPQCTNCRLLAFCPGHCAARAHANCGDINGEDRLACYFAHRVQAACTKK